MKRFSLFIYIFMMLVFYNQNVFAQSDDDEPAILLETTKKGDWTVYTYEKDGDKIIKYTKPNGDFYFDRGVIGKQYSLIHFSDGAVFEGYSKGGVIALPNGNAIAINLKIYGSESWLNDNNKTISQLISKAKKGEYTIKGYVRANDPDNFLEYKEVDSHINLFMNSNFRSIRYGLGPQRYFQVGNHLYDLDENGNLIRKAQKVYRNNSKDPEDALFIFVTPQDSILYYLAYDGEEKPNNYIKPCHRSNFRYKLIYANGDEVVIRHDYGERCEGHIHFGGLADGTHIHRAGNLLEVKNGCYYLTMGDGKKFRSKLKPFKEYDSSKSLLFSTDILALDTLTPYNGMIINPDNTGYEIIDGLTKEEILAKEKAEEEARKKEEAERQAKWEAERIEEEAKMKKEKEEEEKRHKEQYAYLCKQFGKTHVDAALNGQVTIGMPEKLLIATFKPTLKQTTVNKKQYYIYGWGTYNIILKAIVWVTNGKVTSVRNVR